MASNVSLPFSQAPSSYSAASNLDGATNVNNNSSSRRFTRSLVLFINDATDARTITANKVDPESVCYALDILVAVVNSIGVTESDLTQYGLKMSSLMPNNIQSKSKNGGGFNGSAATQLQMEQDARWLQRRTIYPCPP